MEETKIILARKRVTERPSLAELLNFLLRREPYTVSLSLLQSNLLSGSSKQTISENLHFSIEQGLIAKKFEAPGQPTLYSLTLEGIALQKTLMETNNDFLKKYNENLQALQRKGEVKNQ